MPEITVTKTTKVVGGLGKANKAQKKLGLNVRQPAPPRGE